MIVGLTGKFAAGKGLMQLWAVEQPCLALDLAQRCLHLFARGELLQPLEQVEVADAVAQDLFKMTSGALAIERPLVHGAARPIPSATRSTSP